MRDAHVVTLVPWRASDLEREVAWDFVFEHLQSFNWPIYTGDSTGLWNRSEAINRAAADADETPWDIAVVADADTVHDPADLNRGVAWAAKLQTLVVPWRTRYKLSAAGSERFMVNGSAGYSPGDLDLNDRTRVRMPPKLRGGTTIIPRSVWDRVGGFDEGFVGWGHEDVAFRIAAATLTPGRINELLGTVWHLHHAREIEHSHRHNNDVRLRQYRMADGNRVKMMALLEELEVISI